MLSTCAWPADVRAADYCEFGEKTVVFLIDRTTAYDQIDREQLLGGIDPMFKQLGAGERLVVQTVAGDHTRSDRLFDACVAGCPETNVADWFLSSCSSVVAKQEQITQKRQLAQVFKSVLDHPESHKHSDIAATISSVVNSYQAAADRGASKPVRLVVLFSYLLENSEIMSWRRLQSTSAEAFVGSMKAADAMPRLADARVVAFGFGRSHDPGRPALQPILAERIKDAWRLYFSQAGAEVVSIGPRFD